MSATTSNKDELSPTHEHIIAGIVILLFGLLYCFFNCDWTNNSLPASPPPVANTVNSTLKKGLPVTAATTSAVVASTVVKTRPKASTTKNTDKEKATNSVSQLADTVEENIPEISDSKAIKEIANTEKQTPEETTEAEPQPAEEVVAKETLPPVTTQSKAKSADNKVQPPDAYQLPDGTPVKISADGFEGELQQNFANNTLNKALIFDQIYFDSGSNKINAKSDHQIQVTAALMNTYPKTSILLRGHTDSKGAPKKNIELSLMRANSMGLALGSLGINTERIRILGMGDAFPIESNDTEKGRKKNRRIEILLQ